MKSSLRSFSAIFLTAILDWATSQMPWRPPEIAELTNAAMTEVYLHISQDTEMRINYTHLACTRGTLNHQNLIGIYTAQHGSDCCGLRWVEWTGWILKDGNRGWRLLVFGRWRPLNILWLSIDSMSPFIGEKLLLPLQAVEDVGAHGYLCTCRTIFIHSNDILDGQTLQGDPLCVKHTMCTICGENSGIYIEGSTTGGLYLNPLALDILVSHREAQVNIHSTIPSPRMRLPHSWLLTSTWPRCWL